MNQKMYLITGLMASGKSTISALLAKPFTVNSSILWFAHLRNWTARGESILFPTAIITLKL